jgi:hypothetical protein
MKPQVCPTLDNSFWRRAEHRLNILTGVTLGSFLLWIGKAILVAFLSGHVAAAMGGR